MPPGILELLDLLPESVRTVAVLAIGISGWKGSRWGYEKIQAKRNGGNGKAVKIGQAVENLESRLVPQLEEMNRTLVLINKGIGEVKKGIDDQDHEREEWRRELGERLAVIQTLVGSK